MTIKEVTQKIAFTQLKLDALRQERNDLIKARYKELYNIETWHKLKVEYVYSTIAKEAGLKSSFVKKLIQKHKD